MIYNETLSSTKYYAFIYKYNITYIQAQSFMYMILTDIYEQFVFP